MEEEKRERKIERDLESRERKDRDEYRAREHTETRVEW